jgi:molybdenum cofactor cytidylyltransferase
MLVENAEWQRGIGTSIRCGLLACGDRIDAVVLLTCDQPFVDALHILKLIAMQATTGNAVVASSYANTLGVPALFDRSCFDALLALPPDAGAKSLIAARSKDAAAVAFEDAAIDIDTPADFERLIAERE